MKAAAIWMLVLLLCVLPGRADCIQGAEDDALSVRVERFDASRGLASMTLLIENHAPQPQRIYLIDPTFNDAPAAFLRGWNTDEITVEAGGSDRIEIAVRAANEDALPERVSLRYAVNGRISSPMTIRCAERDVEVTPASFSVGAFEALVLSSQLTVDEARPRVRSLSDRLSADDVARLDYARAVICLRRVADGKERFVRVCTVPARVDADGRVRADYSGYVATFSQTPDFPLSATEETRDGQRVMRISHIVLSGDAVFFASLALEICEAPDGSLTLGECTITSEELGGVYHSAPRSLFSEFSCANPVVQMEAREGAAYARVVDDLFITASLDQSLAVQLKPASALGDVYAYFEYHFPDRGSIVHAPFPL